MVEVFDSVSHIPEDKRIIVALGYLFGWIGGLIVFLIAGNDRTLKFHALQSILLNVLMGFLLITICGGVLIWLYVLYGIILVLTKGDFRSFLANWIETVV